MHLCPVDLRKPHFSIQFDIVPRYRRLQDFSWAVGFDDEARWLAERVEFIRAGTSAG